jgi:cytochrome c5
MFKLKSKSIKRFSVIGVLLLVGAVWIVAGCSSQNTGSANPSAAAPSTRPAMSLVTESSQKGGAQLWGETCARCHNYRPPQYYSDAQWDLIVHHMRLRANLTGAEAREITKFLQASN